MFNRITNQINYQAISNLILHITNSISERGKQIYEEQRFFR